MNQEGVQNILSINFMKALIKLVEFPYHIYINY